VLCLPCGKREKSLIAAINLFTSPPPPATPASNKAFYLIENIEKINVFYYRK
jgi:hypothetical protein